MSCASCGNRLIQPNYTFYMKNWDNKTFKGSQFNSGVYDESYDIFELEKMGLPFAMACFEIGNNEVIAIGMDRSNQSPRDFIDENQNDEFVLDTSKAARKIKTMFGDKIVHYAKRVSTNSSKTAKLNFDFEFTSSDHLRYENGKHVAGPHGGARRLVKVQPNITGGEGFSVTIYNLDGNHPLWRNNVQMGSKQMKVIEQTPDKVVLRGYGHDNMGASFADYGMTIYYSNGECNKAILHMHDRNVDIEYLQ